MGLVSNQNLFISTLTFTPCHVAVCVIFLGCEKVIFSRYYEVNRTYLSAQLAYGKKLGSNVTFVFGKNSVQSFIQCTEYIFVCFIRLALFRKPAKHKTNIQP